MVKDKEIFEFFESCYFSAVGKECVEGFPETMDGIVIVDKHDVEISTELCKLGAFTKFLDKYPEMKYVPCAESIYIIFN